MTRREADGENVRGSSTGGPGEAGPKPGKRSGALCLEEKWGTDKKGTSCQVTALRELTQTGRGKNPQVACNYLREVISLGQSR